MSNDSRMQRSTLSLLLELTKIRITSFVTLTTVLGYVLAAGQFEWEMLAPVLGILLLACGSAVLNQFQERDVDALMARTRLRPIPSGRISARAALSFAISLAVVGSAIIFLQSGLLAASLAILALIWYNGVYTPLKKKHPFAVVPGSLIGSLPPMVGWVAAGGAVFDQQIVVVASFFFLWQIPHFWLLLLFFDDDYRAAGFATLSTLFSKRQVVRLTFIWMFAIAVLCLGMPLFGLVSSPWMMALLVVTALYLIFQASRLFFADDDRRGYRLAFRSINYFALVIVLIVSLNRLMTNF